MTKEVRVRPHRKTTRTSRQPGVKYVSREVEIPVPADDDTEIEVASSKPKEEEK